MPGRATPLLALRDALVVLFEGLTPPDYSPSKYHHVLKVGDGASAHRQFWFRPPKGDALTEQGKGRFMIRHEFHAVVTLHVPERSDAEFDAVYTEAMTLISAVNTMAVPPGVHVVQAMGYFTEQPIVDDEGDQDLVIVLDARTKEANP